MQIGDLPPELHFHIANYVCDSNGCAGTTKSTVSHTRPPTSILALEQVSKYWSSVANQHRYHNLRIFLAPAKNDGIESTVTRLLRTLESLPAHSRRTAYLHISEVSNSAVDPPDCDFTTTLPRLISLLSPTLQHLTLSLPSSRHSTSLFAYTYSIHFSKLTFMSLEGLYPPPRLPSSFSIIDSPAEIAADSRPNFPALQVLKLSGIRNPGGFLYAAPLHLIFPVLRTLAFADLSGAPGFAKDVALAVASHDEYLSLVDPAVDFSKYQNIYALLSHSCLHRSLPLTLARLVISAHDPPPTHQGPGLRPSYYLAQRHAKMMGLLMALENRRRLSSAKKRMLHLDIVQNTT